MSETLLTVAEVASRLGCHPHTVRRWIWSKKMKAVKVGDLVRVPEQELLDFAKPADRAGSRGDAGPGALLAAMRRLKGRVKKADTAAVEENILEAERPAQMDDPLA